MLVPLFKTKHTQRETVSGRLAGRPTGAEQPQRRPDENDGRNEHVTTPQRPLDDGFSSRERYVVVGSGRSFRRRRPLRELRVHRARQGFQEHRPFLGLLVVLVVLAVSCLECQADQVVQEVPLGRVVQRGQEYRELR